jgi:hypothetical protein
MLACGFQDTPWGVHPHACCPALVVAASSTMGITAQRGCVAICFLIMTPTYRKMGAAGHVGCVLHQAAALLLCCCYGLRHQVQP